MRFRQRFQVQASLAEVWQLHEDPKALPELTPPPIHVRIIEVDRPLRTGATLRFWMGLGRVGVHWHAVYDEFRPYQPGARQCGFVDRVLSGPFHSWTHRHTFDDLDDGTTSVTDEANFELLPGLPGRLLDPLVGWPAIALLFAYRRYKTRQLLAQHWQP